MSDDVRLYSFGAWMDAHNDDWRVEETFNRCEECGELIVPCIECGELYCPTIGPECDCEEQSQ